MGHSKKKNHSEFFTDFMVSPTDESFNLHQLELTKDSQDHNWITESRVSQLMEAINLGQVKLDPYDDSWNTIAQYIVKPSWLLNSASKKQQQRLQESLIAHPQYIQNVVEVYRDVKRFQRILGRQHNFLLTLIALSILQTEMQDDDVGGFLKQVQEHLSRNTGIWRDVIQEAEWCVNQLQIGGYAGLFLNSIASLELPTNEIHSLQSTVKMWLAQENARLNLQQKWIKSLMPAYQKFIQSALRPPTALLLSKAIWESHKGGNQLQITVYLGEIYLHWSGIDAPIDLWMNNELLQILPPKEDWQVGGDQYWKMPQSPSPYIHFVWQGREIYVDISQ